MFAYIWEYFVKEGVEAEFERLYGPDGDWVQLFRKVDGYIATDLYRDIANPGRYVTTDFWRSKEARDRSRQEFAAEFAALDKRGDLLTEQENFLGDFDCFSHRGK